MESIKEKVEKVITLFEQITNIKITPVYIEKGNIHKSHKPSLKSTTQGVYMFFSDYGCLKVGMAGSRDSNDRWSYQHYNPYKAPSTLAKSILKDNNSSKKFSNEVDKINKNVELEKLQQSYRELSKKQKEFEKQIESFIKENTTRVELTIVDKEENNTFAIHLLEAIGIYFLKPEYEGKPTKSSISKK